MFLYEPSTELAFYYRQACAIHDHDTDMVIITGGFDKDAPSAYGLNRVHTYNQQGWQQDLPNLKLGRYWHACSSFVAEGERVR